MKRIANFWPYSTTLFDYTRRAMPWQQPMTLANDEVYALTAYILALNKLIGENDTMNARDAAQGANAEPRRVYRPLSRRDVSGSPASEATAPYPTFSRAPAISPRIAGSSIVAGKV